MRRKHAALIIAIALIIIALALVPNPITCGLAEATAA